MPVQNVDLVMIIPGPPCGLKPLKGNLSNNASLSQILKSENRRILDLAPECRRSAFLRHARCELEIVRTTFVANVDGDEAICNGSAPDVDGRCSERGDEK